MSRDQYQEITEKLNELHKLVLSSAKDVLSVAECSAFTGLSTNTLYALTSRREIPFYKPRGGCIYFKKSEIENWLLQNRQATHAEINSRATTYCATHK